jgi:spore germination protein KC
MRLSRVFKIIAVLFLCLAVSGCANSRKLKDLAIVEGLGIDSAEQGTSLTFQVLSMNTGGSAQTSGEKMTVNISETGRDIPAAEAGISESLSKRLFFGQNKIIVIGRELAERGMDDCLGYVAQSSDSRGDVSVCMSSDTAKAVLSSSENGESVPSENLLRLIGNNELTGQSIGVCTAELLNYYSGGSGDFFLPVLEPDENNKQVRTGGIALFSQGRAAHITNADETLGFVLMNGKPDDIPLQLKDEKLGEIGVKLSHISCTKDAVYHNGVLTFKVGIKGDITVNGVQGVSANKLKSGDYKRICDECAKRVEAFCTSAFEACKAADSDALRVGKHLAKSDFRAYYSLCQGKHGYLGNARITASADLRLRKVSDNIQVE